MTFSTLSSNLFEKQRIFSQIKYFFFIYKNGTVWKIKITLVECIITWNDERQSKGLGSNCPAPLSFPIGFFLTLSTLCLQITYKEPVKREQGQILFFYISIIHLINHPIHIEFWGFFFVIKDYIFDATNTKNYHVLHSQIW